MNYFISENDLPLTFVFNLLLRWVTENKMAFFCMERGAVILTIQSNKFGMRSTPKIDLFALSHEFISVFFKIQ